MGPIAMAPLVPRGPWWLGVLLASVVTSCHATPRPGAGNEERKPSDATADAGQANASGPPYRFEIKTEPALEFTDFQGDASAWHPAPELAFEVEPPVVSGQTLTVTGVLKNPTAAPLEAVTLAGGPAFFTTNPWNVTPKLKERVPLDLRAVPEVYPYPVRAMLPPGGRVRYIVTFDLARYVTTPGEVVSITYYFALWNAARTGSVTAKLP